jgi:hypothetical protein
MCNFMSALVIKEPNDKFRIACYPELTDSHDDLIAIEKLDDDELNYFCNRTFVKIEFTPPDEHEDITDLSKWTLRLDEQLSASEFKDLDWYNEEAVRAKLENRVRSMFKTADERENYLIGGCYILLKDARFLKTKNCRIISMRDNSKIYIAGAGTVVEEMCGHSSIWNTEGNAYIKNMFNYSKITTLCDHSVVGSMYGNSNIQSASARSSIDAMFASSSIDEISGTVVVRRLYAFAKVTHKRHKACVLYEYEDGSYTD